MPHHEVERGYGNLSIDHAFVTYLVFDIGEHPVYTSLTLFHEGVT
jgi:hypothetical protein